MNILIEQISVSPENTMNLAKVISSQLKPGDIICLIGPLGAGKTCFVRGLAQALNPETIAKSPSISIINEYPGIVPLIHMDFYRLEGKNNLENLGWYDYLDSESIICIEWPEKILSQLPSNRYEILFSIISETDRKITIRYHEDTGN